MKVTYSIGGCTFAGGGIGNTSYHAAAGIHRHQMLKQLIVADFNPTEIDPALITKIPSRIRGLGRLIGSSRADSLNDLLHAKLAKLVMKKADLFHGWAGMSLEAARKAKDLGMTVVIDRASSHIQEAQEILSQEAKIWNLPSPTYPPWSVKRERQEYQLADYIFTPSEFARQSFLSRGFPKEKIKFIPFGIQSDYAQKSETQESKTSKRKKFNALFVGQVGLRKGILYALQAWKDFKSSNKGTFFVVGPITKRIQPLLKKYESEGSIQFTGFAKALPYYQKADVFLFPSLEEGSALVTYEALAHGLPLITTFNSGSIIQNGKEGFLVPLRNTDQIRECLGKISGDHQLRKQLSQQAKRKVKNYTWHTYGESIVDTYQEISNSPTL